MTRRRCRAIALCLTGAMAAAHGEPTYTVADFLHVLKLDAHVHANTDDHAFLDVAREDGFELLTINVDYPDFPSLAEQARIAHALRAADPARIHFATSFSMQGFGTDRWTRQTDRAIDAELRQGAVAVKIWKNVGMVERNSRGLLIKIDDHGFDGVMRHIQTRGVPLIAHQAEPKNCWLPLEQMTTENDRSYFREHPEYHMYLHPEMPGYEDLMAARDRFVSGHPGLSFVGAHLASLEWSVDVLATFLDRHANATVDLAARMTQVQYQSQTDRDKVRRFFLRYQDRLLYGTDLTENPITPVDRGHFKQEADRFWRSDWMYLATAATQHVAAIGADVPGLALPESVIDKIYYLNARRVFGL